MTSSTATISSVWRFRRASRHLTNRGTTVPFDGMSTVMNLQGKRISPDKRGGEGHGITSRW